MPCRYPLTPSTRPHPLFGAALRASALAGWLALSGCAASTAGLGADGAEAGVRNPVSVDPASAAPPAPPACATDAAPYRDFDFWIGEWGVTDPASGAVYGTNSITRRDGGCLLVEEWRGAGGSGGSSLNFVDPRDGRWRQVWMSDGFLIDYSGERAGDAMTLEGQITYSQTPHADAAASFPFRGRWTLQADGAVLQEFWQQDPESGAWSSWFAGLYTAAP